MNECTNGNVGDGQCVTGLDVCICAGVNNVAVSKTNGSDDVALLALGVLKKCDVCASVGVVLNTDYGCGKLIASLEIDDSVLKLVSAASQLLEIPEERLYNIMVALLDDGELSQYKIDDVLYVMTNETADHEDAIARHCYRIANEAYNYSVSDISALIERAEVGQSITFAKGQREALCSALENGMMILTG